MNGTRSLLSSLRLARTVVWRRHQQSRNLLTQVNPLNEPSFTAPRLCHNLGPFCNTQLVNLHKSAFFSTNAAKSVISDVDGSGALGCVSVRIGDTDVVEKVVKAVLGSDWSEDVEKELESLAKGVVSGDFALKVLKGIVKQPDKAWSFSKWVLKHPEYESCHLQNHEEIVRLKDAYQNQLVVKSSSVAEASEAAAAAGPLMHDAAPTIAKIMRTNMLGCGRYGLRALEPYRITARQLEAGRRAIVRNLRKGGKMWIRIVANKPVTAKPIGTRMGKGKGPVKHLVAFVKPGKIIYEVDGVAETVAREAIKLAGSKMPIRTEFVSVE